MHSTLNRMGFALLGGTLTGLAFRRSAVSAFVLTSAGGYLLKRAVDGLDTSHAAYALNRGEDERRGSSRRQSDETNEPQRRTRAGRRASPRRIGAEGSSAADVRQRAGAAPTAPEEPHPGNE